ncbi:hypothetical protein RvY_15289-1 [Ramazzottius varieornatus]|uniref:RRM domain-containing protein n=1 Tax=Ramazzottius varieornatus TaxID=947166 RepID=A0A1D1VXS9_RAMVA|nr:hypothetical protein RvY_15289-1 [Ramazzottius varieornatus]
MAHRSDSNATNSRNSILSTINDLVMKGDDTSDLLKYLATYSALKADATSGEGDLLAALQGVVSRAQSGAIQHPSEATSSGSYSQVYQLSATPEDHRRKMVVSNLARETTVKSLVEYFRRYGQVNSVQMNGALKDDGPASAVLEFHNPISVKDAVERGQHVVDGQIVTCKPYQVTFFWAQMHTVRKSPL